MPAVPVVPFDRGQKNFSKADSNEQCAGNGREKETVAFFLCSCWRIGLLFLPVKTGAFLLLFSDSRGTRYGTGTAY